MSDLQDLIEDTLADVAFDVSSLSSLDADQRDRVQETARIVAERVTLWVVDAVAKGVQENLEALAAGGDEQAETAAAKAPETPDLATVWAQAVLRQAQAAVGQLVVDGARRKVDRPRRQG